MEVGYLVFLLKNTDMEKGQKQNRTVVLFPVSDYKIIKPYLEEFYGFFEPLIYSELAINYCDFKGDCFENILIRDIIRKHSGCFLVDNPNFKCEDEDNLQCVMESVLNISKNIYIGFDSVFYSKFEKFITNIKNRLKKADTKSPEYANLTDKYMIIINTLLFMGFIVYKYRLNNNFDLDMNTIGSISMNYYIYKSSIRPDLLKLYKFLHKLSSSDAKSLTIKQNGSDNYAELDNQENWLSKALNPFFNIFLEEKNIEEVKKAYKKEYSTGKKTGRKEDDLLNWMVRGTYKLLKKHDPFTTSQTSLTEEEARFIFDYIRCLGFVDYTDKQYNTRKIRNIIQGVQPKERNFNWIWLPPHIDDPYDIRVTFPWKTKS